MTFDPLLLLVYVAICAIVGFLGRGRSVGFAGIFTLSLLISPIAMALVLLVAGANPQRQS